MRILNVITSVDPASGGPIENVTQMSRVVGAEHVFEIASLDAPDAPHVAACPIKVHAFGPTKGGVYAYSPTLAPWLRAHRRDYDAVLVRGIWQYGSYATWRALRRTSTPYFVFPHGMLDPWFKRTYPLKHLKKLLYWPWAEFRVLCDARAVCFTSEEERILARQSFRFYRAREAVVNYGTAAPPDDSQAQLAAFYQSFPKTRGKRLLLFLSRIHVKKGADLLIEAFARVAARDANLQLVMAGPDQQNLRDALQTQAEKLGIGARITWTGMVQGDLKWGAYRAAEAFVLPSHQENFGIVVAEALACGVPVLISDKINIWREIQAAGAGLVAPDTIEGTTINLGKWLELDDATRAQMSENARRCFAAHFEIEAAARSFLEVIGRGARAR